MGVCGYTYSEVQRMPIDALSRAIKARKAHDYAPWNALFNAFAGGEVPARESARQMSVELFDALFPG